MDDQLEAVPGAVVYTYDYSRYSLDWVTNPAINPPLAKSIGCLAKASGHKVVIVAHSMGGLAVQVAQGPQELPDVRSEIEAVITLGTPTLGAFLETAGRNLQLSDVVVFSIIKFCGFLGVRDPLREPCSFFSSIDTPAGRAMTPGSPELAALPQWSSGLSRHRIAGDINYRWTLFHRSLNVDLGDGVVSQGSATAGGTDQADVVSCSTVDPISLLSSPCLHTNEPSNDQMIGDVLNHVRGAVERSMKPQPTVRLATPPSDPRSFLSAFLQTWISGDSHGLTAYGPAAVVSGFVTAFPPARFSGFTVAWDGLLCVLGNDSGGGGCQVLLYSRDGDADILNVAYSLRQPGFVGPLQLLSVTPAETVPPPTSISQSAFPAASLSAAALAIVHQLQTSNLPASDASTDRGPVGTVLSGAAPDETTSSFHWTLFNCTDDDFPGTPTPGGCQIGQSRPGFRSYWGFTFRQDGAGWDFATAETEN